MRSVLQQLFGINLLSAYRYKHRTLSTSLYGGVSLVYFFAFLVPFFRQTHIYLRPIHQKQM